MLVNTAINAVTAEIGSLTTLEQEQEFELTEFLKRKDVLHCSSSLIYQLAPLMMKMLPGTNPVFITVWPFVALMEDQI